jgi:hypothetical protein
LVWVGLVWVGLGFCLMGGFFGFAFFVLFFGFGANILHEGDFCLAIFPTFFEALNICSVILSIIRNVFLLLFRIANHQTFKT